MMLLSLAGGSASAQHVTVDGRLSPAQTLAGPNYAIGAALGRQVGGNLFHSFGAFGLTTGETATFSGPPAVANIIGRVTGGAPSAIDGRIRSTIPGASLFLINPAGVLFGPNGSVDVSGSFHASSADYLRLSDGARFQATNPDASTLTAAPPAAFGFLSSAPRPVTVSGSTLGPVAGTLGLVGGPVTISGGTLSAPGGTIHVTSAAGPGEVAVNPRTGPAPTVTAFGAVAVTGNAKLMVSDTAGRSTSGDVAVHGGAVTVLGSEIDADNFGSAPGGTIGLLGEHAVTLGNGAKLHTLAHATGNGGNLAIATPPDGSVAIDGAKVTAGTLSAAPGGALLVSTGTLSLDNGALVLSSAQNHGPGGTVRINAAAILLDHPGTRMGSETTAARLSDGAGHAVTAGSGGQVTITGGTLTLSGGAAIAGDTTGDGHGGPVVVAMDGSISLSDAAYLATRTAGRGSGGNLTLATHGDLVLEGDNPSSATVVGAISGAGVLAVLAGAGPAGSVAVLARDITLHGYSGILSNGPATPQTPVAVSVTALGNLHIEGTQPGQGAFVAAATTALAPGGAVEVAAQNIDILGGGTILSGTVSSFQSGAVSVRVADALRMDGTGGQGLASIASGTASLGNAGPVTVDAGTMTLLGDAQIFSSVPLGVSGAGGDLTVTARGSLTLDSTGAQTTGATISSKSFGIGNAGSVTVRAQDITLRNGASIASNGARPQFDPNNRLIANSAGGNVTVTADGAVTLSGGDAVHPGSHIDTDTQGTYDAGAVGVFASSLGLAGTSRISSNSNGSGAGGPVTVTAGGIDMTDSARISASSASSGRGGTVQVSSTGDLRIASMTASIPEERAAISVEADGDGPAGDVSVHAARLSLLNGAIISAVTQGPKPAGNVTVAADQTLLLDGMNPGRFLSAISVESVQSAAPVALGPAGQVTIQAHDITLRGGAAITSSSSSNGDAGTVRVTATGTLLIDASGSGLPNYISATTSGTGQGGNITVIANDSLTVRDLPGCGCAGISVESGGKGDAGNVTVSAGHLLLQTGGLIVSTTYSDGNAGMVDVQAGDLSMTPPGQIVSGTMGSGKGGSVRVAVEGNLTMEGDRSLPYLTLISAQTGNVLQTGERIETSNTGPAGTVWLSAGSIKLTQGAVISSASYSHGSGGDATVTSAGPLALDDPGTAILASATGTGPAGRVSVIASDIAIGPGARIAGSTAGPAPGGNVSVAAPGEIALTGDGPQITATATGTGDAGSITVAAGRLLLTRGASISTEALTANGGSITVRAADLLYLQHGRIVTTVDGARGNGGNIDIDPRYVVLNAGTIQANAEGGNGGNIRIQTGALVRSSDSAITATSTLGLSGVIDVAGLQPDLNGHLAALPGNLRAPPVLVTHGCALRGAAPEPASLLVTGPAGLRHDPGSTVPSRYFPEPAAGTPGAGDGPAALPALAYRLDCE